MPSNVTLEYGTRHLCDDAVMDGGGGGNGVGGGGDDGMIGNGSSPCLAEAMEEVKSSTMQME